MEQHPVPQNVTAFQFKLFGNLTVRQFVTLAIPASVGTLIFFAEVIPTVIRFTLSAMFWVVGLFIALVPIGGRPFEKWLLAFIRAIFSPTQRIWVKGEKIPEFLEVIAKPLKKEILTPQPQTEKGRERLTSYLRSLPQEATPLDIAEQTALERLGLAPVHPGLQGAEEGKLPPPIIWTSGEIEIPYNWRASLPQVETLSLGQAQDLTPQAETKTRIVASPKISPHAQPYVLPGIEKKLRNLPAGRQVSAQPHLASETNFSVENIIPIQTPDKNIKFVHGVGKTRVRKLHFGPPDGFDLSKLPIRGERRFEVSEELKRRYQLGDPFRQSSRLAVLAQSAASIDQKPQKEDLETVEPLKTTVTKKRKGQGLPKPTQFVPRQKVNLEVQSDVSLKPQKKEVLDSKIKISGQKSQNTPLSAVALERAQIVPLTNRPNVLSGLVTDFNDSSTVGAILTVRDANGIPVRALKTNKLGQFLSATSLENGQYTIEVEGTTANFRPITINLTGQVLAPLEIKAEGGTMGN
ncbi:MAG: PrgI family protein [Candidatus Blackburnbacteria bacterium]|nr:PrgI family protein [Candidatus Blackburnbacteria bacterium]